MTVALPTGGIADSTPRFVDRGGVLEAALGGDDQRLDRLGSKFGSNFVTKPMKAEEARVWIARLIRGKREKASIKFPQPGLTNEFTLDGTVSGANAANAEVLNIALSVGQAGRTMKEGQFISLIKGDKRYLHQVTAAAVVLGSGALVVSIQPPLRTAFVGGEVVEILTPKIEGYVRGDEFSWNISNAKIYGLSFDIEEAA